MGIPKHYIPNSLNASNKRKQKKGSKALKLAINPKKYKYKDNHK